MKRRISTFRLFVVIALSFQVGLAIIAEGQQIVHGCVPADIARLGLKQIGRLDSTTQLPLAICLPLRNQKALDTLLRQLYDPSSTEYHRFLTPDKFTAQFGPTEQDYQSVIVYAKSKGMTINEIYPSSRELLNVKMSVADIERVFYVKMHTYRHPKENRTFYAPDVEPSLDLSAPIFSVVGLNNYHLPRPLLSERNNNESGNKNSSVSTSGYSGPFGGNDFRNAYCPGVSLDGSGQTVALVEFDGYDPNDISNYFSWYGISTTTTWRTPINNLQKSSDVGSNQEVAMDIEVLNSMAPGLSYIDVYEEPVYSPSNVTTMFHYMGYTYIPRVISCSWALDDNPNYDFYYKLFIAQGQAFFQAAGDHGPNQPQDDPYVTLVGFTDLTTSGTNHGGSWAAEAPNNYSGQVPAAYTLFHIGSRVLTCPQMAVPRLCETYRTLQ